jgi:hypothetical protein
MAVVGRMTVPVVEVVGVVAVRYRLMTAICTVLVIVIGMGHVALRLTLIPVALVDPVGVSVVEIVGVIAMGHGYMAAIISMGMAVVLVSFVRGSSHCGCSSFVSSGIVRLRRPGSAPCATASLAM